MEHFLLWFFVCFLMITGSTEAAYYGKSLGKLSEFHHGVSGHVYAVDGRTLFIKDFTYDGEGPAAYFYVGNSKSPSNNGAQRLRDDRGSTGVLRRYRGKDITLTLPEGKTFHSFKWFSVWCDEFSVNFGDVKFPRNLDFPKPQKISGLSGVHDVSSDPIVIVDAQTLLIPNFSYDGEAPDAKFWVGRGSKPSPQGIRIPDENGKVTPLRKYDHKTIVLTLPEDLTIFDIGHFGVWCEAFTVDFGHINIPQVSNVPPSLKMLGVSPQSKLNCEVLYDDLAFEVRWAVAGESVVVQLVAKLEDGEYMSFGLSGDDEHSQMVGSDVTVAWVDKSLKGYAYDYYLDAKSQCAGTRGSCPDERLADKTNSVRLLNAAVVNGYSIVTYQRPLKASDELDRAVLRDKSQPIVWAIGPLNSKKEVSYHTHFTKEDKLLDFGRPPAWNCPMPEMDEATEDEDNNSNGKRKEGRPGSINNGQFLLETSSFDGTRGTNKFAVDDYDSDISETAGYKEQTIRKNRPVPTPKPVAKGNAWDIPPITCYEPEDGVFYAQMGPTGGKQGYSAITGHVGWGISWYINGLLIPEINVVRGKTYTFVTEGGHDASTPARYHPFYITDDPIGGYEHKTSEERANIRIFAGVRQSRNGDVIPTGVGRLCNWTPDLNGPGPDEYASFGAYQRSLTLQCDVGEPGVISWTPDRNTPDTVYYQCYSHRYLGWKINVLDACENDGVASEIHESFVSPDSLEDVSSEDLISKPSIRVATRVKPDNNFLENQNGALKKNFNVEDNHNSNQTSPNRVNIREVGSKQKDENVNFNHFKNSFSGDVKHASAEFNHKPDFDGKDERHPVYHHTTPSIYNQQKHQINDDFPNDPPVSNNKPMTLQTFMRPHGKPPMMGNNNIYYRRPAPLDMRVRRPGMPKPIMGMPHRMPPPPFMMGQPNFMGPHKKPIYKMPLNRPPINGFARPPIGMPMKNNGLPQKQQNSNPQLQSPNVPNQPIILGKPSLLSQTLTLGQPTLIGHHVVKGQMSLPTDNTGSEQKLENRFFNKPGQIIMGKPMDNPIPLDQQMIPSKEHNSYVSIQPPTTTAKSYTPASRLDLEHPVYETELPSIGSLSANITPSDFINSSVNADEALVTMKPAVNTGFKPDSVVIEGGFKPIIREPLLSGGDRITDYDSKSVLSDRSDADSDEDEKSDENTNQVVNNKFYEQQFTESFEPMFIPSPPDRHIMKFANLSQEAYKLPEYVEIDRRPIYVFPEVQSKEKKASEDMAMAADRVDAYYLPPNHKSRPFNDQLEDIELPAGTVVSYDGHTVSDSSLTTPSQKNAAGKLYSSKLSSNAELLMRTPQFGPFRGEIPSLLRGQISSNADQVTKLQSVNNKQDVFLNNNRGASKATHLTLVNSFEGDAQDDDETDLKPEGSENHEVNDDEYDEETGRRAKREVKSSDNATDHSMHDHSMHDHSMHDHSMHDHSMHDHSMHDHSMHDHSQHTQNGTYLSSASSFSVSRCLVLIPVCLVSLILI